MIWRRLFPIIFLFAMVDGFISNWMYPDQLSLLYRDIFILGVYLFFVVQEPAGKWVSQLCRYFGPSAWILAGSFLFVGLLQIFNPLSSGVLVGLVGFKVTYFYWPLAILAYAYVDSVERVRRLFKAVVYFSIPVNLFGLYQFWQGPEFLVTTFGPGFERATIMAFIEDVSAADSFMRVIGTFASSGQYSSFLVINAALCFALLFSTVNKRDWLVFGGCVVLTFLALLATGSRTWIVVLFVVAVVFAVLCHRTRRIFTIALLIGMSFYYGFMWLGENVTARFESLRNTEMVRHRSVETASGMPLLFIEEYPLGRGLGTASTATRHLVGEDSTEWALVENHPSKLQYEMGLPGLLLFFLLLIALSIRWLRRWLKPLDRSAFDLAGALTAYCLSLFITVGLFGNIDQPPHYLFLPAMIGIVARLSAIASMARQKAFVQYRENLSTLETRNIRT